MFDASTEAVSPDYFDIVGARPSAGRFFSESDDAVVIISEGFRRRIFGNGPAIGETIKVRAKQSRSCLHAGAWGDRHFGTPTLTATPE
jgi:hypothetical protein